MAQITLRDYLQETEDAIASKQIDKALANCQSILAYFPDSLEGQRLLGEVYLAQNRLEDAQHAFDWVLSNDPENVIVYCSRALVSERLSDYDTALDCYQQAYELSRGNSQIRQAFNQLSEQVGQQGFMLSRAGLARLYMRGDLLEQSIQEWDVVLAAMPDRLDARTGLLEAYWREGFYDQAAQLANQILRDVPGCLKALVLLAHVTAPQDMLQSQELMKRAEALDPDLITAHDLFADHIASQSRDPFLKLLKKPLVVIGEDVAKLETVQGPVASVENPVVQEKKYTYASASASPSDALATWGSIEGWSNEKTLINPPSKDVDQQAVPSFGTWNADAENHTGVGIPQSLGQTSSTSISDPQWNIEETNTVPWSTFQPDMPPAPASNDSGQPEPWQLLQNALNSINPEVVWSQPSQGEFQQEARPSHEDTLPAQSAELQSTQESSERVEEVNAHISDERRAADSQEFSIQEENDPFLSIQEESDPLAPPAWLSMLTQTERNQLSGMIPVVNPAELRQASQPPMVSPQPKPELAHQDSINQPPSIGSDIGEEGENASEEESFFGPNWLKSLGAATLDSSQGDELSMAAPQFPSETFETVKPQEEVYETRLTQAEQSQAEPADESWAASSLLHQQEQPKRGSWLDSLSSLPAFDQQEQQEPAERESSLAAEVQPEIGQEQGEQPSSESWSSHWSEVEQAQPSWLSQMSQLQAQSANEPWQPLPVEAQPQANEKSEQNLITTLEELEQKLRSRGFIPLEPNSLSTIAQTQNASPSFEEPTHSTTYNAQDYRQEPSLSSALAELGNFIQSSSSGEKPITASSQPSMASEQPSAEPSWLASLRAVPASVSDSSLPEVEAPGISQQEVAPEMETAFSYEQSEANPIPGTPLQQTVSPVHTEVTFSPTFEATDLSTARHQQDALQEVASRMNPLLDSELETTMKRPAVRLQPMQRRALPAREMPSQNSSRAAESVMLNAGSGNASYRERLLRGYQSQLIGDYDNAMQEYRIIIRNTPELLGEVVSNLRALLKLAPKYSAGYRVLGDAYMRQGEYLQAMEAYNKALTMAKKAKS